MPALQLSRPNLSSGFKNGALAGPAAGRQRLRSALVVAEVALAVVLLVGAALFIGSFVSLLRIDPGFSPDHVLTALVAPRVESRTQPRDSGPAFAAIVDRISRIPGVVHASMTAGGMPLGGYFNSQTITIPGKKHVAARPLRHARTGDCRRRNLRAHGVPRRTAHTRDWCTHRARRQSIAPGRDGTDQSFRAGDERRRDRKRRGLVSQCDGARAFLFRLEPTDPRALGAAVVSLLVAALVASAIPARRATSVDPMVALRTE